MAMDLTRMAMPPSLTAFTSRRLLAYDKLSQSRSSSHGSSSHCKTDHGSDSEATCYASDSAISDSEDDSEDQWEDDPDYDAHGGLIFRRITAEPWAPKVSDLSRLMRQQREAGIPAGTVAGMAVVGTCGAASPDPLRSNPTGVSSPLPASRLRHGEMDTGLHTNILDENNALFLVRKRSSRRWTGRWEGDAENEGASPVRRTQSAPNMRRQPGAMDMTPAPSAGSSVQEAEMVVRGGVRDLRSFRFRKFEYVDDYEAPETWSWGTDYHSKGW